MVRTDWVIRLKVEALRSEFPYVHFERLVIEAGGNTFTLQLDQHMTVVSGMQPLERDGLATELVAAVGAGRTGVHLEITSDAGNRYALFRPAGGRHRVVDVDNARDVSESFAGPDGTINLLARAGLDQRTARRHMRVTSNDLNTRSRDDHRVAALARLDQDRLWDVAAKVVEREERLSAEADAAGSQLEDVEAVEEIERRHKEFEEAQAEHERARRISFLVAANLTMATVPVSMMVSVVAALPFLVGGIGVGGQSFRTWRRMASAREREQAALAAAGASTYLAFHLDRVNRLMADDLKRKALIGAAEDHRAALAEWTVLAGDVPVSWAVEHRTEIRASAAKRRASGSAADAALDPLGEITATLDTRLAHLRQLGPGGESFPMILDEPFVDLPTDTVHALLDRLLRASDRQQVIILTDDAEVAGWARTHSGSGQLRLIEPAAAEPRQKRSRGRAAHLVA